MFSDGECMFPVAERMFRIGEHTFTIAEHKLSRDKNGLISPLKQISLLGMGVRKRLYSVKCKMQKKTRFILLI